MVYTQPPAMTHEEIESHLKATKVGRFCSLNKDGTIHAAPVWYNYDNGQLIILTPAASRKAKNAKRNPNVTLLVDASEVGVWPKGVIVYGKAELSEATVEEIASVWEKYAPKERTEKAARGLSNLTKWIKMTIRPSRVVSFDYTRDEEYKSAAGE
ncbi:MAG TPA: pyridoxamine 5'-phosphate oxidase family protein [Thermoproteota archaeon]|nr:pyridoxamine 5'-phosphate oxidase family protein [Thermoproteota archaeon]